MTRFSFDSLVTEVDTIVEDLRWLHLELHLRNRLNETLFQDFRTVDEFIDLSFQDLREKLGVLDISVLLRHRNATRIGFRDVDDTVSWKFERMPWTDAASRLLNLTIEESAPQAEVNHYIVNAVAVTSIAVPVVLHREHIAVILLVTYSSSIVPRLKKLLTGLSGSLSLSIDYTRKRNAEARATSHNGWNHGHLQETVSAEDAVPSVGANGNAGSAVTLASVQTPFLLLLDQRLRIEHANDLFVRATGYTFEALRGRDAASALLPEQERPNAEARLERLFRTESLTEHPITLPLQTAGGERLQSAWHAALVRATDGSPLLALFGGRSADGIFDDPAGGGTRSTGAGMMDGLTKNYRFMMKYVPFPIVHLDETLDIIRNANPAFTALIGTQRWEGMPLSDFATLDVHEGGSDTRPCTLYVLSPAGITLTYRGIITRLPMLGKTVREIKLDPIE